MNTDRRRTVAALTAAGLLWGTTVPLSKLALGWLAPGWLTFVRFGLAAAILLAVAPRAQVRAACTPSVLASGAIGYGGSVVVQNAGITRTSVSHAALLIGATPVLVAIIAALWHRTVARPVAWVGFAVSLAGVGLVAGGGGGGATATGDGLVLASLLVSAAFTVAQVRRLQGRDPVALTAVQFLGAALAALPFSVAAEGVPALPAGPGVVLAVAGLAAGGTLLPFTLFAYAQGRVSPEVAGAFLNLEPLVGAVAGVVVFGDPAGPVQLAGGAAILAGIALSSLPLLGTGRRGPAPEQPGPRQGGHRPQPRRGPKPRIARCRILRPSRPQPSILRCRIPLPRNARHGRPPRCRPGNGGPPPPLGRWRVTPPLSLAAVAGAGGRPASLRGSGGGAWRTRKATSSISTSCRPAHSESAGRCHIATLVAWQSPTRGVPRLTAGSFDDGRADAPGGLAGTAERVLVVGAGIAGLTVANALAHGGVECVVLEARDRIGGRLHTVDLAGSPVDLGGSWIHMPSGGNPMRAFAGLAGVPCRSADPVPEMAGFDYAEGRRLSAAEAEAVLALYLDTFPEAAGPLAAELGPDASAADGIEAFLAAAGLAPGPARRARQTLYGAIEAESADLAERQSLRWMWNEFEYDGNYFGDVPDGGYRRLVDAMATGVDLRLGAEVTEVALSAGGVRLRCADGTSEEGSHVVVTVPLGVLKRGGPRFSPALPPDRLAAIERLGFGRYEKVVMRFDEPFWRAAGFQHLMFFPRDPGEWMVWAIGHDAFGAGPVLVFFVFHSAAGRLLDAGPDAAARWALDMLAEATGRPCPEPKAVAVTSWASDPYSGGAYTHIPPGASPADADLLGEPVGGRLLFAGEHTQSARLAYADGAMTSGIREAKRLLGVPSVRLGPVSAAHI